MFENADRNDRVERIVFEWQRLRVRLREREFAQTIELSQVNAVAGKPIVEREANEIRAVSAADFKN